ncbi:hypothetical protein [Dyadobacter frigoris]|uniref:Uncharacterized protein n=1 Tax=Dyadobacter frigoris TaxID=2576211 RepID=A0A4U6D2G4_9BACT|nr:hypothetical protein [Dyadobacter frigoris]TKT90251.1 hypothetical protein FDK13_21170 [Dyadobacter frigoris]GLU52487.1 hypothetical protein Dfri01_19480 [Dyadobacter frigoris]
MSYFDIFRIDYEDLKMIADHPESIITRIIESDSGYIGEIALLGEYPGRASNILFFHEDEFKTEKEASNDLKQIIETVTKASESTRNSEALRKSNLSE